MKVDHDYWYRQWLAALSNTPRRPHCGQWGTLARLLGLPLYSPGGSYTGHTRVYANLQRGSKPRDAEVRRKLLLMASPLGNALAWRKLRQLGIAKRYVK